MPRDRWLCIELALEVADPGRAELFLDGVSVVLLSGLDVAPSNGFSRVTVGIPWTDDTQQVSQAFVDEVVVDRQSIGCD